ncbi:MAG: c-type cytochrome [Chitinophagaceae bacterium]|nr:MAG: c-type cytochrome [Chitinophagaceae bacterium]
MKKIILLGSCFSLAAWAVSCKQSTTADSAPPVTKDSLIKRGSYLVATMGCDDCHTPKLMTAQGPAPDMEHRLSGHPAGTTLPPRGAGAGKDGWVLFSMDQTATVGPWGVSYAANISPDSTGIGVWSEQQFATAIRKGKWKGLENSRELMPPMPWRSYQGLNDADVKALYTYLMSIKPVKNVVPAWEPPAGAPPAGAAQ